jgi:hypothetical protein
MDFSVYADTVLNSAGKKVTAIVELCSDGKLRVPTVLRSSAGEELFTSLKPGIVRLDGENFASSVLQTAGNGYLESILAKLASDPATQTTLSAILTKMSDQATQTTLAAVLTQLQSGLTLNGSLAEKASSQVNLTAASVTTYNRASGSNSIEIYVESGNVRVRTDGTAATATTGEPLAEGFCKVWAVASVSIYAVDAAVITEVSR